MDAVTCNLVDVEALPDGRVLRQCSRCNWQTTTEPGRPVNRRCGPPLTTKARNAMAAGLRVGAAAISGSPVQVDEAEQSRRLAVCSSCDRWTGSTCALCGCLGGFKARLATEKCPHPDGDRWG